MKTCSHLSGYEITPGTQTETHLMFYPDCFRRFHNRSFYLWPVLLLLIMIGRDALCVDIKEVIIIVSMFMLLTLISVGRRLGTFLQTK